MAPAWTDATDTPSRAAAHVALGHIVAVFLSQHTVEIAPAAGSSGLMNLQAIAISRWVTYENRWNAVVPQAWGAVIRTAATRDGFARVPPRSGRES